MAYYSGIRGKAASVTGGRRPGTEGKSAAFSRYYNDPFVRSLRAASPDHWSFERAIIDAYERDVWVYKSVTTIAADSARLPYRLRDRGEEVEDHPSYRVLNKRANQLESGKVFRKRLSSQVLLSDKGAFVHKVKSGSALKEVHLLPPDRTEIIPGTDGTLVDHVRMTRRDGTLKNFEPDEVSWFREPHPSDPYGVSTPLSAASASIQLSHYARLYNVSFMQNDGRPGGVLAVRDTDGQGGSIPPAQMDRIEQRFGKGPVEAGKLSVIAGQLEYIDLAAKPRDMQYAQTSANAKAEILGVFGMSEVVLGNASGRTFDNADADLYTYWSRTIPAHNEIIIDGFDEDASDDLEGYLDTSGVEVLERPARREREEARAEFGAGLRTLKSYAELAGRGDEVEDTIYSRSYYIANGKTPLPSKESDIEALGLGAQEPAGDAPPQQPGTPPGGPNDEPVTSEPLVEPDGPTGGDPGVPEEPGAPDGIDLSALTLTKGLGGARPKGSLNYSIARKAAAPWSEVEVDEAVMASLEAELAAALTNLAQRWVDRAAVRLGSPKQRKGTRHWAPEYALDTRVGTKALDTAKAVDEQTWQEEAEEAVSPIVTAAAVAAAVVVLTNLGISPPTGQTLREFAATVVRGIIVEVVQMIGRSAARQARMLVALTNRADQEGSPLGDIVALIRDRAESVATWADGVSVQGSTATVNGASRAAIEVAVEEDVTVEVEQSWITRRDDKVRASHRGAHGQKRPYGTPFIVGSSLLRFPGDPRAPVHETANCRCRLLYRHRSTGRFVAVPVPTLQPV